MEEGKDPQEDQSNMYSRQFSANGRATIKEGWGEKESGQKIFGHYNWRRRWFRLTAKGHIILFSYYTKPTDSNAKGEVMLNQEYTARELEMGEKSKPNCFALGPLTDSSALRTYYVSCDSEDDKVDWITTLNCVIEGVLEKVLKRKSTYRAQSTRKDKGRRVTYPPPQLSSKGDTFSYQRFKWRMDQWKLLCREVSEGKWKKCDTKNGISIARQSFRDSDLAVIKIESVFNVPKQFIYEYLQRALRPGGKFDFIFRGETVLQRIEGIFLVYNFKVLEKVLKRKSTYRAQSTRKDKGRRVTYPPPQLSSKGDTFSYQRFKWRMDQWKLLCREVSEGKWKKCDTKNGISIARQSFRDSDLAVIKIESVFNAPKQLIYEYLQRALRPGGKFDFIFRGETVLQRIEEFQTITEVVRNDYDVPLPGMKKRDVCLAKMWLPDFITSDGTAGLLVMSVKHPSSKSIKDMERAFIDVSGMVLYDQEGENGEMCTRAVVVIQVDLQSALQNMLRGAFKSGLLKRGIRNGFSYFSSCLNAYKEMLMI
ncbi:uncharacterized protein LOC135692007 [Rhopilema esculentum]|uniref:uncharacterized protein LOC135692007 n=1 Tax=Rhopilema esculentum TaxID=499914 RepID=UPI0031DC6911